MNGIYYFAPDTPVTRSEFLSMAMNVAGIDTLEDTTTTGFWDDASISGWAKPYVASALQCGLIQGKSNELGQAVFSPDAVMTTAEASVLLDRLLNITDVNAETFGVNESVPTWAVQSVANLSSCGVISSADALDTPLTRANAAQLLCGAMKILDARDANGLLPW